MVGDHNNLAWFSVVFGPDPESVRHPAESRIRIRLRIKIENHIRIQIGIKTLQIRNTSKANKKISCSRYCYAKRGYNTWCAEYSLSTMTRARPKSATLAIRFSPAPNKAYVSFHVFINGQLKVHKYERFRNFLLLLERTPGQDSKLFLQNYMFHCPYLIMYIKFSFISRTLS